MRTTRLTSSVLLCTIAAACGPAAVELPARDIGNATPFADAGTGSTHRVRTPITLDGRRSYDPDGQIVAYRWNVVRSPLPTLDVLADEGAPVATLTPGAVGAYVLELEVEDDRGATATSEIPLWVAPPAVAIDAGADRITEWLHHIQLTGTLSTEPGFTVTPRWRFESLPAGSRAVLADATTLTPSFVADVPGTYELVMIGLTEFGAATNVEDRVSIVTTAPQVTLRPDWVMAAEYSRTLGLVVALVAYANIVVLYEPATGIQRSLELPGPFIATSMTMQPSGRRVVVRSEVDMSVIDLETATITQTFPALGDEIALDDTQRIHSPPRYSDLDPLQTLDVTTGTVSSTTGFGGSDSYQEGVIRIHPGGTAMYVIDGKQSAIARYDIAGAPTLQRQASYPGPTTLRAPVFITEDGASLVTGGGTVLHASTTAALDMTIRGQLSTTAEAAGHSSVTHEIATLSREVDAPLTGFGARITLSSDSTFAPRVAGLVPPHGGERVYPRLIAYRADGAALYVLVSNDHGTVLYTVTAP